MRRWLAWCLKLGMLGGFVFFASLWIEHRVPVELPLPTGPFPVGRITTAWAEPSRELVVWIWYPAARPGATRDDYLPAPLRAEVVRERGALISQLLTRDLSKVRGHSLRDAEVSTQKRSYPVVIMRAGASSEVTNYTTLAEDLASQGYVVVGFDAPYRTGVVVFPDGRVMKRTPENNAESCEGEEPAKQASCVNRILTAWTSDVGFALDRLEGLNVSDPSGRLTGRLDMTRVGVFGHSFGGATALEFCHGDARCKAGIDLDGQTFGSVVQEGLRQPFMFLLTDQIHGTDPETRRVLGNIQSIYDRLPVDGRMRLAIRGSSHFLFSDDGALLKSRIVMRTLRLIGLVGIDGRRQLAVTAYCVHSFFDEYLRRENTSWRKSAAAMYPEIEWLP